MTERSEEHSPSTDTGHTAQTRRGTSQRFKLDCWHSSILAPQYFGTADSVRTDTCGDGLVSRDDSDFEHSSLVDMGHTTQVGREVLQHFEFDDCGLAAVERYTIDGHYPIGLRRIPRGTRVASGYYLFDYGCSLRNSG